MAAGEAVCALRGGHGVDLIALGEFGVERRVLEIPHQGRRVEEVDCGDAEFRSEMRPLLGIRCGIHSRLDYQPRVKDAALMTAAEPPRFDIAPQRA